VNTFGKNGTNEHIGPEDTLDPNGPAGSLAVSIIIECLAYYRQHLPTQECLMRNIGWCCRCRGKQIWRDEPNNLNEMRNVLAPVEP